MREHWIPICDAFAGADRDTARKPARQWRLIFESAALRAVLAAAMFAAAATASPHASADGTTEHFFTVEVTDARFAHATRRQVAAEFRKALAAANLEVSTDDLAAAVDEAMKQLADWNGAFPLRGCARGLCWEFARSTSLTREPVTPDIGMGQSK